MIKYFVVLLIITAASFSLRAQISEGHATYKIEFSSDNPELAPVMSLMQGSSLEIYFKDEMTKSEVKMGSAMTIMTITNSKTEEIVMLMGGMMGKKGIKTDLNAFDIQQNEKPDYEIQLNEETKTIEGFLCKKAILTKEDGVDAVFWYTENIKIDTKGQTYLNDEVPGFPMEFEINQGEMKLSMIITSFDKSLGKNSKSLFVMDIPEGYEEMTIEQLGTLGM